MDPAIEAAIDDLLAKGPCRLEVTPTNGTNRVTMSARNGANRWVNGTATHATLATAVESALTNLDTALGG
jgi:hypothetical protein